MHFNALKDKPFIIVACIFSLISCRKEVAPVPGSIAASVQNSSATRVNPINPKWITNIKAKNASFKKTDEYYKQYFSDPNSGVEPSQCSATTLNKIVDGYFNQFDSWDYVMLPDYIWINQLSAMSDRSKQFFGSTGQYTHLVVKEQRKLESFWKLQKSVRINGEHSETLGNRDKIAAVFISFTGAAPVDAYYVADEIISMNKESKVFPESPLLSFDGFSTTTQLIVVGDGLITALTSTGITDDIVVAGLISHEWGHQVQFENSKKWFGVTADNRPVTPAFTRQIELEADFFSSYFLTHKHGGVYNWKKVDEFNKLFYNIGDCNFTSTDHHGTPAQRLAAARYGYTVASETHPKGHILAADALHKMFMAQLPRLLKA